METKKPLLGALLVVVAALLAWQWSWRDDPGVLQQTGVRSAEQLVGGPVPPAAPEAPADRQPDEVPERTRHDPGPATKAVEERPELLDIEGEVVLVDELGQRLGAESGWLLLAHHNSQQSQWHRVTVEDGRFSLRVAPGGTLTFGRGHLGGGPVLATPMEQPVARTVAWEARRITATELRVLDRDGGQHLSAVTVVDGASLDVVSPDARQLARQPVLARALPSPIRLSADNPAIDPGVLQSLQWSSSHTLWVGAEGYAWRAIELDFTAGGQREVVLIASAALEVTMVGRVDESISEGDRDPVLRVWHAGSATEAPPDPDHLRRNLIALERERAVTRGVQRFESLTAGRALVAVEVGEPGSAVILGEAWCVLHAGRVNHAEIELQPTTLARAPLGGTLFIPPQWGQESVALTIAPAEGTERAPADPARWPVPGVPSSSPGSFTWRVEALPIGAYIIASSFLDVRWLVETGATGRTDLALRIGEPAEVSLTLVDSAGLAVEDAMLCWIPLRVPGVPVEEPGEVVWDPELRAYRFVAPAGSVELFSLNLDCQLDSKEPAVLNPGVNTIRRRVSRGCGVTLILSDGGADIEWNPRIAGPVTVEAIDHTGGVALEGVDERGYVIGFSGDGRYRITVARPRGRGELATVEVDVAEGEFLEERIELRRN